MVGTNAIALMPKAGHLGMLGVISCGTLTIIAASCTVVALTHPEMTDGPGFEFNPNMHWSHGARDVRKNLWPTVLASMALLFMYYTFLFLQSFSAFYALGVARMDSFQNISGNDRPATLADIKYGNKNPIMLRADRTVGNTMEQLLVVFPVVWLYALFVNASLAPQLALAWAACRALYPFVYNRGPPLLFVSTLPAYSILWYMMVELMVIGADRKKQ